MGPGPGNDSAAAGGESDDQHDRWFSSPFPDHQHRFSTAIGEPAGGYPMQIDPSVADLSVVIYIAIHDYEPVLFNTSGSRAFLFGITR